MNPDYSGPEGLLSRLDAVKQTGKDRWIARCPAHDDRAPSLSISATPDDKTLVYCFAGCTAHEITESVGLKLADLMPPIERWKRPDGASKRPKYTVPLADLVAMLRDDLLTAAMVLSDALGDGFYEDDIARLTGIAGRLAAALEVAGRE